MSLLICPECNGKVSDTASRCPHCGYDFESTRLTSNRPMSQPVPVSEKKSSVSPWFIVAVLVLSVLLGVLLTMIFVGDDKPSAPKAASAHVEKTERNASAPAARTVKNDPRQIGSSLVEFSGTLGGDNNAWLRLDGRTGRYHFTTYERDVRLKYYDSSTGALSLEAFDNSGKYIGVFNGNVTYSAGTCVYSGVFTNYKNVSIDFRFHN